MSFEALSGNVYFVWLGLPLLIFFARLTDVTFGTVRIIYVSRGLRALAAAFSFVEVLIWLISITQIMQHLSNPAMYLAYAAGFAAGNYVGIIIESKLAVGFVALRLVLADDPGPLLEGLHALDPAAACVQAHHVKDDAHLVQAVIPRCDLGRAVVMIGQLAPSAGYSVEDIRLVVPGLRGAAVKRDFASVRTVRQAK